jgi:hypothetical protein|tara:strand:+ start:206 stop:436 length:231 start_codon:yes stop_codon:yes gene_type:complete
MNLQEQEGWKNQERAYEQGLLAGYTKSLTLIRHLQRAIIPKNAELHNLIINRRLEWEKLEEAIELITENIATNNNE